MTDTVHAGYIPVHAGYIPAHAGYIPVHAGYILVHAGYIPVHAGYMKNCHLLTTSPRQRMSHNKKMESFSIQLIYLIFI